LPEKKNPQINNIQEFYDLKVKDVIDQRYWDLPVVSGDDDMHHVLSILRSQYHVWIVDDLKSMKLCGVITEHDVLNILAPKRPPSHIFGMADVQRWSRGRMEGVVQVMCRRPITCKPDDLIHDVLVKMKKHSVRRLPVVKKKKIVGEITFHTLLNKYYDIILP
jgi:CBS domain-containing protein